MAGGSTDERGEPPDDLDDTGPHGRRRAESRPATDRRRRGPTRAGPLVLPLLPLGLKARQTQEGPQCRRLIHPADLFHTATAAGLTRFPGVPLTAARSTGAGPGGPAAGSRPAPARAAADGSTPFGPRLTPTADEKRSEP
ncbi:hypothetical protein [Streptomyces sp. NPDC006739]|uniref:hypothetical protein n=1 Tax=Streptomyces sp. NPDC006739 TaxID=3364763 RepID=UPI0036CAB11A